jgi:hypothetical protein
VGPLQHDPRFSGAQAPVCTPRPRECLLAGCGRHFTPRCARSCYCSEACRQAARAWSQRKAQERYRLSEKGRLARRGQCRRWRQRRRENQREKSEKCDGGSSPKCCEGHPQEPQGEKILCDRPGCYVRFVPSSRSPGRRFCCSLCRKALRRVREREKRWRGVCTSCPLLAQHLCPGRTRGP